MSITRPTPAQDRVVAIVRANPGVAILPVAEAVGPHGSRDYGYRAVHRAINAGKIIAKRGKGNSYALYVPSN